MYTLMYTLQLETKIHISVLSENKIPDKWRKQKHRELWVERAELSTMMKCCIEQRPADSESRPRPAPSAPGLDASSSFDDGSEFIVFKFLFLETISKKTFPSFYFLVRLH